MYLLYSIVLSIGFAIMLPLFWLRREKYAAGFKQRLGNYPPFDHDGREVIWLHCVSVGETNAARPLVDALRENFPDRRLVFSTTTRTGQELATKIFKDKADTIIYFPFDFKFAVRRALRNYKPSLVLLMETEIWPRFIHEAKRSGAQIAIVNGRLSEKSFGRYAKVRSFIRSVLADVDLALMQGEADARRIAELGMDHARTVTTGNLKYDLSPASDERETSESLNSRFQISNLSPLIVAASTHYPEENLILEAFRKLHESLDTKPRLLIAPRHPERFDEVAETIKSAGFSLSRRSEPASPTDKTADVILLDSIGELRAAYALAEVVFVGGSLIPHGGQNVLEPAAEGKAIVTGPHTFNFAAIVDQMIERHALIRLPATNNDSETIKLLASEIRELIANPAERQRLGRNAKTVVEENRGATRKTIDLLEKMFPDKLKPPG